MFAPDSPVEAGVCRGELPSSDLRPLQLLQELRQYSGRSRGLRGLLSLDNGQDANGGAWFGTVVSVFAVVALLFWAALNAIHRFEDKRGDLLGWPKQA